MKYHYHIVIIRNQQPPKSLRYLNEYKYNIMFSRQLGILILRLIFKFSEHGSALSRMA